MMAMILAAGHGERMRPLTESTPKAMLEVAGTPLIDRQLAMLARAGVDTVVINLGRLGEQIVEHVGGGQRYGLQVAYSPEYEHILDSGGGIRRALPLLGDAPFWVVNADIYTDLSLSDIDVDARSKAHLVLVPTPPYKEVGDFALRDGKVRNGDVRDLTYCGVWRCDPAFLAGTEEGRFSIVPMWRDAADRGELTGTFYSGAWEDVGTPERLAMVNERFG